MSNSTIAKHSKAAFDESKSIRILSGLLESTGKIKTFFGENDKTPNYDGSFELVNDAQEPVKQFIVQIKKVDRLVLNSKGKYDYRLKTNFLQYVKDKVTENPAIYFVVDLATEKVYWVYLSDETLIRLNFEGKKTVTYHFREEDSISNVEAFVLTMRKIARERNNFFVYKTPQQIAEIQDAVDYLNQHLNGDLKAIKERVFPDLWRVGIKYSVDHTVLFNDMPVPITGCVALYPQMRGRLDTGVREYDWNLTENMFTHFSLGSETDINKYSKDTLHKIVQNFFKIGIPYKFLPTVVLMEQIEPFVKESQQFFDTPTSQKLSIKEVRRRFVLLHNYMCFLFTGHGVSENEKACVERAQSIIDHRKMNFYSIFECARSCREEFQKYCSSETEENISLRGKMFGFLQQESIRWFLAIMELQCRKIEEFTPVWNYNWCDWFYLDEKSYLENCRKICNQWLSSLPSLYIETYNNIFETTKFLVHDRFIYNLECTRFENTNFLTIESQHYQGEKFSLQMDSSCTSELSYPNIPEGLLSTCSSESIQRFIQNRRLYYDSICCLLYRGICKGLGFEEGDLPLYEHENIKFFL